MRENWAGFRAPAIGYLFCNDQFSQQQPPLPDELNQRPLANISTLSLTGLTASFFLALQKLNIEPLACIRNIDSLNCTCPSISGSATSGARGKTGSSSTTSRPSDRPLPVTLYHKVGHGTLYMYVLSPTLEGITRPQAPTTAGDNGTSASATIPEADQQSICSLLVWRPHDADEKIARILVPGNATQADIVDGFETLLSMAKVDSRVRSRYAPKSKSGSSESGSTVATVESVELELLLSKPYPVTGGDVESALREREASKAVKFRPSAPGLPLHGYRRSASVAPKVVARRQQVSVAARGRATPTAASSTASRQRSVTPSSRFSRFRSVSPTPRADPSGHSGRPGKPSHDLPPFGPEGTRGAAQQAPPTGTAKTAGAHGVGSTTTTFRSFRAPDDTNKTSNTSSGGRHLKSTTTTGNITSSSRPPSSSASSGDRVAAHKVAASKQALPVVSHAKQAANKTTTTAVSKGGRTVLPAISGKTLVETRPSQPTTSTASSGVIERKQQQQTQGKIFKSGKEFRKTNVEQSVSKDKKPVELESEAKKADQTTPRPVPRKVKKPVPTPDDKKTDESTGKTVAVAGVAAVGVAAIVASIEAQADSSETKTDKTEEVSKTESTGTLPQSGTFDKDLDKLGEPTSAETVEVDDTKEETSLKVLEYEDIEDISIRSTTDEEVLKITSRIEAEREALAQESAAIIESVGDLGGVSISKTSSPAVDSQATGLEDEDDEAEGEEHSARTVTPDIEDGEKFEATEEVKEEAKEEDVEKVKEEVKENITETENSTNVETEQNAVNSQIDVSVVDQSKAIEKPSSAENDKQLGQETAKVDSLASTDFDVETDVIAPPPPTPARPGSAVAEIVEANESMLEPLSDKLDDDSKAKSKKDEKEGDKDGEKEDVVKVVETREDFDALQTEKGKGYLHFI